MEEVKEEVKVEGTEPVKPAGEPPEAPQVDQTPDPLSLQTEIERLKATREKAKEDADYWRRQKAEARADYFKTRHQPPEPPAESHPPPDVGPPPKQGDFDDYDKFLDAKIAFETKRAKVEWQREQEWKVQNQARESKMVATREKILTEGMSKYSDWEDVVMDPSVPITPLTMELLADTELPTELAYHLGKNKNLAIQIARSTPVQAARMLAKIENEIKQSGVQTPPSPRVPGAPPPIKPVGSSHTMDKDPTKMTQAEYESWRIKQGGRRF